LSAAAGPPLGSSPDETHSGINSGRSPIVCAWHFDEFTLCVRSFTTSISDFLRPLVFFAIFCFLRAYRSWTCFFGQCAPKEQNPCTKSGQISALFSCFTCKYGHLSRWQRSFKKCAQTGTFVDEISCENGQFFTSHRPFRNLVQIRTVFGSWINGQPAPREHRPYR